MKRRLQNQSGSSVLIIVVAAVVIAALLGAGWTVYHNSSMAQISSNQAVTQAPKGPVLTGNTATYTSTAYRYTLQYPSAWTPQVEPANASYPSQDARLNLFWDTDPHAPNGEALSIECGPNTSKLDALHWRQQFDNVPANSGDQNIGYVTLRSGTKAYKIVGEGATGPILIYSALHDQIGCVMGGFGGTDSLSQQIDASFNTFRWQ